MKRGNGPRWIVSAAICASSLVAAAVVGWLALPIEHTPRPLQVYLRPTGPFSDTYSVLVRNEGDHAMSIAEGVFSEPYTFEAGPPRLGTIRPGETRTTDYQLEHRPPWPPLQREHVSVEAASSDIWILTIGPKSFALK
jgi:hypothetical protein